MICICPYQINHKKERKKYLYGHAYTVLYSHKCETDELMSE